MRGMWGAMAWVLLFQGQAAVDSPGGITRMAGVDEGSGIGYALISVEGRLAGATGPSPRLTAQCTKTAEGKLRFELLADAPGSAPQLAFYPPWKRRPGELFAPPLEKVSVTMEFLGYMKVKPVKRQWLYLNEIQGEMKYGTPGANTSNMEEVTFYLQYLKALPVLRLTVPGKGTAEFDTAKWQQTLKTEPLCAASGL